VFGLQRASFGADHAGVRATVDGRRNAARQCSNAIDRLWALSDRLTDAPIRNTDWRLPDL